MHLSRRSCLPIKPVLIIALLLFYRPSLASELVYPPLQREGQASITVDERKKAAYVVDLGRYGDGDKMNLDNAPILDRLEKLGIIDLFFVCSHPHSDHMGGIRALFERPRNFFKDDQLTQPRFRSITLVDDGITNNLYKTLQTSLAGNTSINVSHVSATNKNAFAGISTESDDVFIETIPYKVVSKPNAHGKAVVTHIRLGQKNSILDFDDADSGVIAKVVAILKARGVTISTFVVPHHGSRYHDVEPILDLKPKYAVIAVNPQNRYGHPSPPILLKLMEKLGKKNVVFTGSVEAVVLDENGLKRALYTAANKDSYPMFVAQNRIRAEQKNNKDDIRDCALIQKMMNDDSDPGQSTIPLFQEDVTDSRTILRPEFEFGAVSFGSDTTAALESHKIFGEPLSTSTDLTGRDVALVLERVETSASGLTQSEARRALQRLKMFGHNADKAANVHIYFSTPAGFRNVLEPELVIRPEELLKVATTKPTTPPSRPGPPKRRLGSGRKPPPPPTQQAATLPRGGMVFLQGGKLFPVGEATELYSGTLDVCGSRLCIKVAGDEASAVSVFELPFSPSELFSEVWTRVYDQQIDSFYLSINPTKQFLRGLSSGLSGVPTDKLNYGPGAAQGGFRTHEVVTSGNIENSHIGQILWEADVAFKSASLGFDVLKGNGSDSTAIVRPAIAKVEGNPDDATVPYEDRWCRLYWASGSQRIGINPTSRKVQFEGNAVIAKSEPMRQKGGELVEAKGNWCGEEQLVASSLQRQANSRQARLKVLNDLANLAEMQTFIRWVRDNGLAVSPAFLGAIQNYRPDNSYNVPNWTSGIKSEPVVQVQQRVSQNGSEFTNDLHIKGADGLTMLRCVAPFWKAMDEDFPLNGIRQDSNGIWRYFPENYPFINSWMAKLAANIATCSHGELLPPSVIGKDQEDIDVGSGKGKLGLTFYYGAIQMHGGVLLGMQRNFFESGRDRGLLLDPNRRPIFQRDGEQLHFWNFSDAHTKFGSIGDHVVITAGKVKGVLATKGFLLFEIEMKPGAIIKEEFRASRGDTFQNGFEWIGALHGSDGSVIWQKAAWPCAKDKNSSDCVQASQMTLQDLLKKAGWNTKQSRPILYKKSDQTWFVGVNLSGVLSYLEQRWEKTPPSETNLRLGLVYEYAKWGFIEEAQKKYQEIAAQIERETVDTILSKQLKDPND